MACRNMEEALLEDVIEITWMLDGLIQAGEIMTWDEILEEECGSDGLKAVITEIARKFEEKYPFKTSWEDTDKDYLEEIANFSKSELMERYQKKENTSLPPVEEEILERSYEKALDVQEQFLNFFKAAGNTPIVPAVRVDEDDRILFSDKTSWATFKSMLQRLRFDFESGNLGPDCWYISFAYSDGIK